jgi:hypothetical protein
VLEEEDKMLEVDDTFANEECKEPRGNVSMIEENGSMRPVDGSLTRATSKLLEEKGGRVKAASRCSTAMGR